MKAVLLAKKAGIGLLKTLLAVIVTVSIFHPPTATARQTPRQHSQYSSWSTLSEEPFEREPILRGAASLAVPFVQLSQKGTMSLDAEVGHRYVFGPSYREYFRQNTGFADVNVRKAFRYAVIRVGYEVLTTARASGLRVSVTPFAQADFGNWQERHPFQGWA
jgi:hypothetical protein